MENGKLIIDNEKLIMENKHNPVHPSILKIMVQTIFAHLQKMGFVWS